MEGVIIKIISERGYVKVNEEVVICSLRGKVKYDKLLPLVGDRVLINKEKKTIEKIFPRKNALRRPPVSNITQGVIIASMKNPELDTNLIDKLLVELTYNAIKPVIIFTKGDLLNTKEYQEQKEIVSYYNLLYPTYFNDQIEDIKKLFKDEVSVFIGQTGAGKSTLLNRLNSNLKLKTGEISLALGRGKHTTRHIEIIEMYGGLLLDTPGFSSLEFPNMMKEEIRNCFIEFQKFPCPYRDCMHIRESDCAVKEAVSKNLIPNFRYQNYLSLVKSGNDFEYKRRV